MSTITFPSNARIAFKGAGLKLTRGGFALRSPFTGKRQGISLPYAVWTFSGLFSKVDGVPAGLLRSFLVQLDGQGNKFRLPVPGWAGPINGYAGAAGLVNGASQTGSSLVTDGWTISSAIFSEGDYFTVNDELKVVTAAATSNGAGAMTISFKPPLRSSPADNAVLTIVAPTVMMFAASPDVASWDLEAPTLHNIKLEAEEDI